MSPVQRNGPSMKRPSQIPSGGQPGTTNPSVPQWEPIGAPVGRRPGLAQLGLPDFNKDNGQAPTGNHIIIIIILPLLLLRILILILLLLLIIIIVIIIFCIFLFMLFFFYSIAPILCNTFFFQWAN